MEVKQPDKGKASKEGISEGKDGPSVHFSQKHIHGLCLTTLNFESHFVCRPTGVSYIPPLVIPAAT